MKNYSDDIPYEIMLFDIRIIFLITALNIATRQVIKTELNGDKCLAKLLENITSREEKSHVIKEDNATLLCEILKALFNLHMSSDNATEDEKNDLVLILRKLLLSKCEKEDDLHRYLFCIIMYVCYFIVILHLFLFQQYCKFTNGNAI